MESGKIKYTDSLHLLNMRDILLITIILIISAFLFTKDLKKVKENNIIVKEADIITGYYELDKDKIVMINDKTILQIKDGKYRLTESGCTEKICVKMGWCTTQPIICVPQKLIIEPGKRENQKIITY